ncbi:hypothetical protein BU24DRAFT_478390 [Aaosphaeria arxii CBS 175.79]|uniref:Uncharacterized protein n=1 Tax=Aaosphaeria arxii CBS 175.79 TaxID=1450172 RepID=A0A6A5XYG2_9PLEO|nr:uncharacterized protein BU24DRAFT_478390 [Aaosphaeria arxii CBS 175.79]KAF2017304.1 hypothetical protein BU24DRAFT_478390 [Aaosphaeria arxii CBS 175.79]
MPSLSTSRKTPGSSSQPAQNLPKTSKKNLFTYWYMKSLSPKTPTVNSKSSSSSRGLEDVALQAEINESLINALRLQLETTTRHLEERGKQLQEIKGKLMPYCEQHAQQLQRIKYLQEEIHDLNERIHLKDRQCRVHTGAMSRITLLDNEIQQQAELVADLEESDLKNKSVIDELNSTISDLSRFLEDLRERHEELQSKLFQKTTELKQSDAKFKALYAKMAAQDESLLDRDIEIQDLREQLKTTRLEKGGDANLIQKMSDLQVEVTTLKCTIAQTDAAHDILEGNASKTIEKLDAKLAAHDKFAKDHYGAKIALLEQKMQCQKQKHEDEFGEYKLRVECVDKEQRHLRRIDRANIKQLTHDLVVFKEQLAGAHSTIDKERMRAMQKFKEFEHRLRDAGLFLEARDAQYPQIPRTADMNATPEQQDSIFDNSSLEKFDRPSKTTLDEIMQATKAEHDLEIEQLKSGFEKQIAALASRISALAKECEAHQSCHEIRQQYQNELTNLSVQHANEIDILTQLYEASESNLKTKRSEYERIMMEFLALLGEREDEIEAVNDVADKRLRALRYHFEVQIDHLKPSKISTKELN